MWISWSRGLEEKRWVGMFCQYLQGVNVKWGREGKRGEGGEAGKQQRGLGGGGFGVPSVWKMRGKLLNCGVQQWLGGGGGEGGAVGNQGC